MNRMRARGLTVAATLVLLGWASPGQAQETGKKAGERLDQLGRDIKGGLDRAGSATKEQFARARTSVQNMTVESRVYSRIHWDKALNDALIELTVSADGVITLDGTVASAKAKVHAVELAKDTMGVTKVIDQLAVRPAPSTTTTSP